MTEGKVRGSPRPQVVLRRERGRCVLRPVKMMAMLLVGPGLLDPPRIVH